MVRSIALFGVWVVIAGLAPRSPQAGAPPQYLSGSTEQEIVATAEREALAFPTDVRPPSRMKKPFIAADTEGTSERKCVAGGGLGPLRSGEFIIGGELSGKDPRDKGKRIAPKIWWSPLHHGPKMELLVRARRLESSGEYRYVGVTVAYGSGGPGQQVPESEREYFFPSGIEFLHSGKWVIVATRGSDWGCFVLSMPSPIAG